MRITILIAVFSLLTLIAGGNRTAKTTVTTGINALILIAGIYAMYLGVNTSVVTFTVIVSVMCSTIFFQNEFNKKTVSAFLSVAIVLIFMVTFIGLAVNLANLQGFPVTGQYHIQASSGYSGNIDLNMRIIEMAVIVIALTGSLIDTAVAISSGIYEVMKNSIEISCVDLFFSGINIGKDILSSTVNTLFFIFAGEYLVMFVNFSVYYSFSSMVNSKEFAQGTLTMLICAIGCILVIPVTSYVASRIYTREKTTEVK